MLVVSECSVPYVMGTVICACWICAYLFLCCNACCALLRDAADVEGQLRFSPEMLRVGVVDVGYAICEWI